MDMSGRKYQASSTSKYRYGFNGKENDKDIIEGGQDYGMRIYDKRLERFLSVDPITKNYPELTPYQFASNRPIDGLDQDGLEFLKDNASRQNTYFQAQRDVQLKPQETITAYHPSTAENWRKSQGFFAQITYGICNTVYTFPQQLTRGITGQEYIHPIGGGDYPAGGVFGEKQRTQNLVDGLSLMIPMGAAESKVVGVLAKTENTLLKEVEGQVVKKIGETGKIGEAYLKTLGGVSQKGFETTLGRRIVDQFVGGVANESKVGYTTLTKDIRMQIAKDVELLGTNPDVKKVVWNFFRSPETGKVGASQPLLDALKEAKIETKIIELPTK